MKDVDNCTVMADRRNPAEKAVAAPLLAVAVGILETTADKEAGIEVDIYGDRMLELLSAEIHEQGASLHNHKSTIGRFWPL
jgi:hypothetical protein